MPDRWRGRRPGLAIAAILAATLGFAALASAGGSGQTLVVRDRQGGELARVALPAEPSFSLRYRNSLYGSLAEERFMVGADGRMELVMLAADEVAVLEEYYAVDGAPMPAAASDSRRWRAAPARAVALHELTIAATDLGERTLLVPGQPSVRLWQLVGDGNPSVIVSVEERHP
ncbi:MAG: hypothetical protein ACRDGV_01120 [Candidatus Limnocylindria bacterium]